MTESPFLLDTRELGRSPGSQRKVKLAVAAPAGLGIDVLEVPEASELQLDVRLEAVVEGVLASGAVRGTSTGDCVRCLEPLERQLEVTFQELYVYPGSEVEDDEAARLQGDQLDLEPVIRDAVVLALPFQPMCREDCPGLCPECGARLADDPDHGHEAPIDPRWSALAELKTQHNGQPDR